MFQQTFNLRREIAKRHGAGQKADNFFDSHPGMRRVVLVNEEGEPVVAKLDAAPADATVTSSSLLLSSLELSDRAICP